MRLERLGRLSTSHRGGLTGLRVEGITMPDFSCTSEFYFSFALCDEGPETIEACDMSRHGGSIISDV